MEEQKIREALKRRVVSAYGKRPRTLIIEELGLRHGLARIDLAVVNGSIHGFEIKSEYDRLIRLAQQATVFNQVFDRLTLVAAEKHLDAARRIVPAWWGLLAAKQGRDRRVEFATIRRTRQNPTPDSYAVAKLLWREEALEVLGEFGIAERYSRETRATIHAALAGVMTLPRLRARVRDRLLSRQAWRSDAQRTSCGD